MSRVPSDPTRLDAAAERVLVEPVDAVTRGELRMLQSALQANDVVPEGLDPPSLVGKVFAAIMPHISYPGVLRLERRLQLLERLEARASSGHSDNPLLSGSLMTLRHELQNLSLLRHHRDSLIEG